MKLSRLRASLARTNLYGSKQREKRWKERKKNSGFQRFLLPPLSLLFFPLPPLYFSPPPRAPPPPPPPSSAPGMRAALVALLAPACAAIQLAPRGVRMTQPQPAVASAYQPLLRPTRALSRAPSPSLSGARGKRASAAWAERKLPSLPPVEMMADASAKRVGVVGVTGAVGQEIIAVLQDRGFPISELKLFASARSAGKEVDTPNGTKYTIEEFTLEAARACDIVFLAVSGDFALEWAEKIAEGEDGAVVIDNSSAFRYNDDVPLVVPEINAEVARRSKSKLIANPNCTTAIALMALAPLHKVRPLLRGISTFANVDGAKRGGRLLVKVA